MRALIAIFLFALMISAVSTRQIRKVAINIGFVDLPSERKLHTQPIPLLGGVAIITGLFLAVLIAVYLAYGSFPNTITGVLLASGIVALTGFVDDRRGLPAWVKIGGQFIGFIILIYFGIRVRLPIPEVLNYLITFIWLVGISNAINFLDNMDGLSAGVSAIAASFILLLGAIHDQFLVAAVAAGILGAALGFLRYNFPPAKIYMGDTGSLFLGFLLAVLALQLRFPENSNFVTWMVPVMILGVPIFDMTLVVFSRIRRGVSPNTPGKDHVSHRVVRLGFSQRETILIIYLIGGVLGMIALFITEATIQEGYMIGGLVAMAALYMIWRLDFKLKSLPDPDDNTRV